MRATARLLLVAWTTALPAFAADVESSDLPPTAQVVAALTSHPSVAAARTGIRAEEANRTRLEVGPHELALRLGTQQRRVDETNGRFNEWDVGVERTLRLPSKARLDAQLGAQGVVQARLAWGDALHEAARGLLRDWFTWQRERAQAAEWETQAEVLARQAAAVERRARAGDAPRIDVGMAEAALALARAQVHQARSRSRVAAAELTLRYRGIALPEAPAIAPPQPLDEPFELWREAILAHSHALGLARAEAQHMRLTAARSDAERRPDPTLGLRYGSERSGAERIAGVSVSIPLTGTARAAAAQAAQAHAEAALQREAATLQRVEAEAAAAYEAAFGAYANWQGLAAAAERFSANADALERGYALGEGNLAEVLAARRQSIEARLAATLARLDAAQARYRLMLDAHRLWPLDLDDAPPAAP